MAAGSEEMYDCMKTYKLNTLSCKACASGRNVSSKSGVR